jgi:hypothetical protein
MTQAMTGMQFRHQLRVILTVAGLHHLMFFFFERCVYYLTSKPGGSSTETTQYLTMAKSHK